MLKSFNVHIETDAEYIERVIPLQKAEIEKLESINSDLLEACELAQTEILSSKAFNIRKDFTLFNYLAQAINKAKGEK